MIAKFIGCGAAGNKVAINLIEKGIFSKTSAILLNSTTKDIPENYRDIAVLFSSQNILGGCGKERELGKTMLVQCMKENKLDPEAWISPTDNIVILCGATEGGSGSSSIPILAKYFKEVVGIPVLISLFFGFEDDIRGLQNTMEICQELSENYGIMAISNKKFLSQVNNNKIKAEKLANEELATRISVIMGNNIKQSEQNIDDTDLYKLVTTPGYMDVGMIAIDKVKNVAQYSSIIEEALDESKSLNVYHQTEKRLGLIFNISKKTEDAIDFTNSKFIDEFGIPYELFTHVQYTDSSEWVEYIAAGMDMPFEEVQDVYNSYLTKTDKVSKTRDTFFDNVNNLKGNSQDAMFNMLTNKSNIRSSEKAKKNFFSNFDVDTKEPDKKENKNSKTNNDY